jgi:hypothetical protein
MQLKDPVKAEARRIKKAEAARQWRKDNPDLSKQQARERYQRDPGAAAAKVQKWRKEHPDQWALIQRANRLKRKYGLSLDDYDRLLTSQGGRCAICGSTDPKTTKGQARFGDFAVDHDHKTGKVRGLLCGHCNTGLGLFRDDPNHLEAALRYLARHRS